MTTTTPTYDTTHECDLDGELGGLQSVDAHGHLDAASADIFLADTVQRELYDAGYDWCPAFGLEIEQLWRSEHLLHIEDTECWTYRYTTDEHEGAIPVTRFQIASPWARPSVGAGAQRAARDRRTGAYVEEGVDEWPLLCVHHPDEPAVTGIPESRFIDADSADVIDGQVHYCRPCATDFTERLKVARQKQMAPVHATEFLAASDAVEISRAYEHWLRREDLEAVLAGTDRDGRGRRALSAFAGAFRAASKDPSLRVAQAPGYKSLYVYDIEHLVEGYTPA